MRRNDFFGEAKFFQSDDLAFWRALAAAQCARHDLGRQLRQGGSDRFGDERRGAAGPRVDFNDVKHAVFDRELNVHQSNHVQSAGQIAGRAADLGQYGPGQTDRWNNAGAVTRVHARLLDVLHDRSDHRCFAVGNDVDVDLRRIVEEAVDKNRSISWHAGFAGLEAGDFHGLFDVEQEFLVVVDDAHAPAAEDKTWTHQHGKADALRNHECFLFV